MHAVDLKQSGKSYNEILDSVEKKKADTEIYLLLYDLTYAVRGGRVPSKVKTIADLFRLTPILTAKSGKLKVAGTLKGKSDIVSKFSKYIFKKIDTNANYRMLIGHADSQDNGQILQNAIITRFDNIQSNYLLELGGGLGCHAGPGALVVGLQKLDKDI